MVETAQSKSNKNGLVGCKTREMEIKAPKKDNLA
jgi:hypothetical protein